MMQAATAAQAYFFGLDARRANTFSWETLDNRGVYQSALMASLALVNMINVHRWRAEKAREKACHELFRAATDRFLLKFLYSLRLSSKESLSLLQFRRYKPATPKDLLGPEPNRTDRGGQSTADKLFTGARDWHSAPEPGEWDTHLKQITSAWRPAWYLETLASSKDIRPGSSWELLEIYWPDTFTHETSNPPRRHTAGSPTRNYR